MNANDIKAWLKENGKSRQWLADQLGVVLGTVNNWLSAGDPIPEGRKKLIKRLMGVGSSVSFTDVISVPVRFTAEEWEHIQSSLPPDANIEAFLRQQLHQLADNAREIVKQAEQE